MQYNLLSLLAISTIVALADPAPNALPDAVPEAFSLALPKALPVTRPESNPEKRAQTLPAKQCPACPAVLKQHLAPFAGVPLVKEYCASYGNGTTSKNPACQNFGSLLVKNKDLFCCCLFPNGNSTNSTGGKSKYSRDANDRPGLFRRMWRSWSGESSETAKPITLVDGLPVERQALVQAGPRRIGGGSMRHRGAALSLESTSGAGVFLTLEIPDISLPEA